MEVVPFHTLPARTLGHRGPLEPLPTAIGRRHNGAWDKRAARHRATRIKTAVHTQCVRKQGKRNCSQKSPVPRFEAPFETQIVSSRCCWFPDSDVCMERPHRESFFLPEHSLTFLPPMSPATISPSRKEQMKPLARQEMTRDLLQPFAESFVAWKILLMDDSSYDTPKVQKLSHQGVVFMVSDLHGKVFLPSQSANDSFFSFFNTDEGGK